MSSKVLIIAGIVLIIAGLLLSRTSGLGHLPGDIIVKRPGFTLYIPITTMLLLSVGISVLLWRLRKMNIF